MINLDAGIRHSDIVFFQELQESRQFRSGVFAFPSRQLYLARNARKRKPGILVRNSLATRIEIHHDSEIAKGICFSDFITFYSVSTL